MYGCISAGDFYLRMRKLGADLPHAEVKVSWAALACSACSEKNADNSNLLKSHMYSLGQWNWVADVID